MPSHMRTQNRWSKCAVAAVLLAYAGALEAQRPDAAIHHAAEARVGEVLGVRRATYPAFDRANAAVTTTMTVGANVPYEVLVRLQAATEGIIEVRNALGVFQRLLPHELVRVASGEPGTRDLMLAWRMTGEPAAVPISYVILPAQGADEPVRYAR